MYVYSNKLYIFKEHFLKVRATNSSWLTRKVQKQQILWVFLGEKWHHICTQKKVSIFSWRMSESRSRQPRWFSGSNVQKTFFHNHKITFLVGACPNSFSAKSYTTFKKKWKGVFSFLRQHFVTRSNPRRWAPLPLGVGGARKGGKNVHGDPIQVKNSQKMTFGQHGISHQMWGVWT